MLSAHQENWIYNGNFNESNRKLQKSLEGKMQKHGHRSLHLLQKQASPHMQKMLGHNREKGP